METALTNGTKRVIDGVSRVYYDGYWVKAYDAPADTLQVKRLLIEALSRRLFNHVEHGINVPGTRLEAARRAFEIEEDPQRKRVKSAMLAGALFNRVTDIFTKLVDMQAVGVKIDSENALMRLCGEHLEERLSPGARWSCTAAATKESMSCGASRSRPSPSPSKPSTGAGTSRLRRRCTYD